MNGNYIKVSRSLLDWCWYHDVNTCRLFIHMLLRVNWKRGYFGEEVIERGSFVSSISKLSAETGLSEREVRTALEHLKKTGEVTCNRHAKYSSKWYGETLEDAAAKLPEQNQVME